LAGVLDREATLRNSSKAQELRTEVAQSTPKEANLPKISALLDEMFPCP
jgi:hypothetical protein